VANVDLAGSIVDVRGQAILISTYIEDRELANRIRVWMRFAHIRETGPQSLRRPIPVIEGRLRILVGVGKLTERLATDDTHLEYTLKMRVPCQMLSNLAYGLLPQRPDQTPETCPDYSNQPKRHIITPSNCT
jgi:hypothetical protein